MKNIIGFTASQKDVLRSFAARVARVGAKFFVCDGSGDAVATFGDGESGGVSFRGISAEAEAAVIAVGDTPVVVARIAVNGDQTATAVIKPGPSADTAALLEMLGMLSEKFENLAACEEQLENVSSELAQTYEELMLLYRMTSNMKLTESDCNYLQLACDSLRELVNVEGIAIVLERGSELDRRLAVAAGTGVIRLDERWCSILMSRLSDAVAGGGDALLDSEVDNPFRHNWPTWIRSVIAVPLYRKERIIGMMVAANRLGKSDFDSIDVKLFNSVASECAVFIENGRLFSDLKELFIGSLKALTSSIDAKDQYTRGHSERVAFISRWIAEKLAQQGRVPAEQVHRVYLAGLLHDVGKIGISESVLRKNGPLDEIERKQIQSHPSIGASIISEIKQMRDIVPGVLCHHERVDGRGYPNGLAGEQIPLIGKIVMVADSFDAMTSKRTYREAMNIEKAMGEIRDKAGIQFDADIAEVFLSGDISQLWWIMQDGMVEHYYQDSFGAYGIEAVGTLLT